MSEQENVTLRVYVTDECEGCAEALRMLDDVRREFPDVDVEVINIATDPARHGDRIVAVPTWVLEGRTLSLGNPRREALHAAIEACSYARQENR